MKAKRADDLAARLHTALVTAMGRLADPTDLPYDEAHLADDTALGAAVDDLLARVNRTWRRGAWSATSGKARPRLASTSTWRECCGPMRPNRARQSAARSLPAC